MGGTLLVGTGAVEDLQAHCESAAGACRAIDLASPLDAVSTALPGSQTAAAASAVSVRLAAAAQVFAERADALALAASSTVESYGAVDSRSTATMAAY